MEQAEKEKTRGIKERKEHQASIAARRKRKESDEKILREQEAHQRMEKARMNAMGGGMMAMNNSSFNSNAIP